MRTYWYFQFKGLFNLFFLEYVLSPPAIKLLVNDTGNDRIRISHHYSSALSHNTSTAVLEKECHHSPTINTVTNVKFFPVVCLKVYPTRDVQLNDCVESLLEQFSFVWPSFRIQIWEVWKDQARAEVKDQPRENLVLPRQPHALTSNLILSRCFLHSVPLTPGISVHHSVLSCPSPTF